jgi:Zn-dependent protease with chaperone function
VATELTVDQAVESIAAPMPRIRKSIGYRLAALGVGLGMLLLPMLYVALIVGVGAAIVYHAVYDVGMLGLGRGRGALVFLVLYIAPIIIGLIVLLFMIKPLVARSSREDFGRSLTAKSDPVLFAFVDRLCEAVHAPKPCRIDVDVLVNASASLKAGLGGFVRGQLVLTIGVPLIAGLTARQLAGVLAHEFGHFAQGGGIRMTYVIRRVNLWFARVVYQRDAWDDLLDEYSRNESAWIAIIMLVAKGCVWLSRRVLHLLMLVGGLLSGLFSRQMEFDADRYEVALVGSKTFEQTQQLFSRLSLADNLVYRAVSEYYSRKILPDNLPAMVVSQLKNLPKDLLAKLEENERGKTTSWYDTHPSDERRVNAAKRLGGEGILRLDGPASRLFCNFDSLCRNVSVDVYRQVLGKKFQPSMLRPSVELMQSAQQANADVEAFTKLVGGMPTGADLAFIPSTTVPVSPRESEQRKRLRGWRKRLEADACSFKAFCEELEGLRTKRRRWRINVATANASGTVYFQAKPEDKPRLVTRNECLATEAKALNRWRALVETMQKQESMWGVWVLTALDLLTRERTPQKVRDSIQCYHQLQQLVDAMRRLRPYWTKAQQLDDLSCKLYGIIVAWEEDSELRTTQRNLIACLEESQQKLLSLQDELSRIPYPLPGAQQGLSLGKYVIPTLPDEGALQGTLFAMGQAMERLWTLRDEMLALMTRIVITIDDAVGIDPPDDMVF